MINQSIEGLQNLSTFSHILKTFTKLLTNLSKAFLLHWSILALVAALSHFLVITLPKFTNHMNHSVTWCLIHSGTSTRSIWEFCDHFYDEPSPINNFACQLWARLATILNNARDYIQHTLFRIFRVGSFAHIQKFETRKFTTPSWEAPQNTICSPWINVIFQI